MFVAPTTKPKQRAYLRQLILLIRQEDPNASIVVRRLRTLLKHLHNRSGRRGRRSSPPTARVRAKIRRYRLLKPRLSMQEISVRCGCSIGRVSEILRGKRK